MINDLSKVDSNFREISDTFLFSSRKDVNLTEFTKLLNQSKDNLEYFLDSFKKACGIYWINNEEIWSYRFNFLISNLDEEQILEIENFLEKRMFALFLNKGNISPKFHIEYVQFLQYYKSKSQKGENLFAIKNKIIELIPNLKIKRIIYLVNSFIPFIFKNMQDFFELVISDIVVSENNFRLLLELEKQGIIFDRQPVIELVNELILERSHTDTHARALFFLIKDPQTMQGLKNGFTSKHNKALLALINESHFYTLEGDHFINIKNLVALAPSLADDIASMYITKIYNRTISHKRANADRIIRLLKAVPQISPKKILARLAAHNQMSDIRYIAKVFPELKKLAVFV